MGPIEGSLVFQLVFWTYMTKVLRTPSDTQSGLFARIELFTGLAILFIWKYYVISKKKALAKPVKNWIPTLGRKISQKQAENNIIHRCQNIISIVIIS